MPITHDQLVEGGPVFFTSYVKGSSGSGLRRMAAKVIDVHDDAATIQLLHNESIRQVKFNHLEPDLDWLSKVYEEKNKADRKRLAREAQYAIRTPLATKLPIPEPGEKDYSKLPDIPQVTMSEPPALADLVQHQRDLEGLRAEPPEPESPTDHHAADVAAYLELGSSILKRIENLMPTVPEAEREPLEERRRDVAARMEAVKTGKEEGESMPRAKGQRVKPPELIEKVLKDLRNGMTQREVSQKHKVSTGSMWLWQKAEREAQRKKAAPSKGKPTLQGKIPPLPKETQRAVLADVAAGLSPQEAGDKHGVNRSTVYTWMKNNKLKIGRGRPELEVAEPEPKPVLKPDLSVAQEENRRLRAALARLLAQEPTANDAAALAEDNRKLRLIIDMWLGLS